MEFWNILVADAVFAWANSRSKRKFSKSHHASMCFTSTAYIIGYTRTQLVHFVDVMSFSPPPNFVPVRYNLVDLWYCRNLAQTLTILRTWHQNRSNKKMLVLDQQNSLWYLWKDQQVWQHNWGTLPACLSCLFPWRVEGVLQMENLSFFIFEHTVQEEKICLHMKLK